MENKRKNMNIGKTARKGADLFGVAKVANTTTVSAYAENLRCVLTT